MIDDNWFHCLPEEYKWIEDYQDHSKLLDVVNRVLETGDYSDITEVYESSVWAVCHAYIDYRLGTSFLSPEELEYTKRRSGILGVENQDGVIRIATIREFLEEFDHNFMFFMLGHDGPSAA